MPRKTKPTKTPAPARDFESELRQVALTCGHEVATDFAQQWVKAVLDRTTPPLPPPACRGNHCSDGTCNVCIRALPIAALQVSTRTRNALRGWFSKHDDLRLGDVIDNLRGEPATKRLKGFGRSAARELREELVHRRAPADLIDLLVPDMWSVRP